MDIQVKDKTKMKRWESREGVNLLNDLERAFPRLSVNECKSIVYQLYEHYMAVYDIAENEQVNMSDLGATLRHKIREESDSVTAVTTAFNKKAMAIQSALRRMKKGKVDEN